MPLPLDLFEPVFATEAMREADRRTMQAFGLPGRVLMETAGRGVADALERHWGPARGRRVLVLCGPGHNGGDGFVVARVLHARGADVRVVALRDTDLPGDAAANLRLLREVAAHADRLRVEVRDTPEGLSPYEPEWAVDALLGIGVTGALRPPVDTFTRWLRGTTARIAAVDVPSGLDSTSGRAADGTVRATLTVTMAARKPGLLFRDGPAHAGHVEVVDIGVPPHVAAWAAAQPGSAWRSTDEAVRALVPPRAADAHKYTAGRVLVVAGSHTFPAAAAMAGLAAARAGAGAVTVAAPARAREILAHRLVEVMSVPLPETAAGTLARAALDPLLERAARADALVVGPGLGRDPETQALLHELLPRLTVPLVLDADGLSAFAGHTELLARHANGRWVLTPHLGELARLTGQDDLEAEDRIPLAATWATRWNAVLVVKGMPSVVGTPGGPTLVSAPTTPALATAGTGDVLAGTIAALLAQGLEPAAAALAALHLGGRAAERFTARHAVRSMRAMDLLRHLPHVLP